MKKNKTALPIEEQPVEQEPSVKQEQQQVKRYVIATFLNEPKCDMFYTSSLCESAKSFIANNIAIIPTLIHTIDGKVMAFNQAITFAWKEKVDGIIFISSDAVWSPQALFELISSDKDCVSLPVMTANGIDIQLGEIPRLQRDENTGEIKVSYASLDFMYLSAYTINELCNTHHSIEYQGQNTKLVLQTGDIFTGYYNESQILKSRMSELNIDTWVNPNHTIPTRQIQIYTNDFNTILSDLENKE
jgi:hypothetical protein